MAPLVLVPLAAVVAVADVDGLRTAVANAKAGDEIVLENGTYRTGDVACAASGPIVVRAKSPRGARIELTGDDGFAVSGASWTFADVEIQGVCSGSATCAHAFRIDAAATGFVARNDSIADFDVQVTAVGGGGRFEGNAVFDTHPRPTTSAIRKIDLAGADDWVVRANVIRDFRRADDVVSHGVLAQGGKGIVVERNLFVCTRDEARSGAQIGIALVGHSGAIVRNNIVASCAGVAVDVSDSPGTKLFFDSLVATNGVALHGATTTLDARGNLLEGAIVASNGAAAATPIDDVTLDGASVSAMYVAPALGDLRKKGDLSAVIGKSSDAESVTDDFCGRARGPAPRDVGAIEHSLGDCIELPDAGATTDGGGVVTAPPSSSSSSGGASTSGSAPAAGAAPPDDGGCRVASGRASTSAFAIVALVIGALGRRRRDDR